MGKSIGSANIAASFNVLADAPLDSRTVVDTVADLTASGTFDYKYVGMPVYCKADSKTYVLTGLDPTQSSNWKELGSGGGGSSALEDLTDVTLTSPTDGQALVYDETNDEWVNETIDTSVAELGNIGDVDLTNIADGQILKWDDTNSKWVNANESGGGGGDAELEEAVTANTAAGAIEVGTTLPQGMTFTEFVKALVIAEVDPTINFSISQSGTVPSGSSYTETLTCAVTNMGSAKKIKTISWYEGETLKRTDNVNSTVPATWTYTMSTATTDTTTFKAIVTYQSSKDIDVNVEKTATITFGSFKYYGAVDSLDPTEATVKALTQVAATSRGGAYAFTTVDNRACYAYPKSFGALTAITDPNGFNLFYSFTRTEQTYTIDGQSVDYYRYVLTDEVSVENFTVTFT